MALEQQVAAFDLTLTMAEVEGELAASLQYNTALFDQATMQRLLGHFQTLLEGIVADPQQQIASLLLCSAEERHQVLVIWNNTDAIPASAVYAPDRSKPRLSRRPTWWRCLTRTSG